MHCKYKTGNPINGFPIRSLAHPAEPIFALTLPSSVTHIFPLQQRRWRWAQIHFIFKQSNSASHSLASPVSYEPSLSAAVDATWPNGPLIDRNDAAEVVGETYEWECCWRIGRLRFLLGWNLGIVQRDYDNVDNDVRVAICSVYNMYIFDWNSRATFNAAKKKNSHGLTPIETFGKRNHRAKRHQVTPESMVRCVACLCHVDMHLCSFCWSSCW